MTPADVVSGAAPWCLVLGDCLDTVAGMACLPDGSVEHVITDPPYEAEAHTKQRRLKRGHGGVKTEPLSFVAISPETRLGFAAHAARLARRWVLAFCQAEAVATWATEFSGAGLDYKRACVWIKTPGPGCQPQLTGDRPGMGYETICAAHSSAERSRWNGGGRVGVYDFDKHAKSDQGLHETQKPLALMEALVRDFTDPGDLVVDPFAGSGTTGVACIRLGRRFIGFEKDAKFYEAARRRLEQTHEQPELVALESFKRAAKGKRKQTALDLPDPE